MNLHGILFLGVHSTVGHLTQLSGQGSGVHRIDFLTLDLNDQLFLHLVIHLLLVLAHADQYAVHNALRHLQVIRRPHGNGDVSDLSVDLIFRAGPGLIGENLLHATLVGNKVGFAVPGDKPSEPLAHVQEPELCPQIHQTVAAGCTRQAYDTLHGWPHLQEALESFCLPAFEGRQLVDHNHVIPEGQAAVFHQPLHVFPVDDVQEGRPHQRCQTLLFGADGHTVAQALQVIPFLKLRRPCVPGHPQRGNHQHPADFKGI